MTQPLEDHGRAHELIALTALLVKASITALSVWAIFSAAIENFNKKISFLPDLPSSELLTLIVSINSALLVILARIKSICPSWFPNTTYRALLEENASAPPAEKHIVTKIISMIVASNSLNILLRSWYSLIYKWQTDTFSSYDLIPLPFSICSMVVFLKYKYQSCSKTLANYANWQVNCRTLLLTFILTLGVAAHSSLSYVLCRDGMQLLLKKADTSSTTLDDSVPFIMLTTEFTTGVINYALSPSMEPQPKRYHDFLSYQHVPELFLKILFVLAVMLEDIFTVIGYSYTLQEVLRDINMPDGNGQFWIAAGLATIATVNYHRFNIHNAIDLANNTGRASPARQDL